MNPIIQEAIDITNDLGDVTFIGAVAVLLHTKQGRGSQDLDFVIAVPISKEELEQKRYFTRIENGKEVIRSPRGYKVDIYYSRPINKIPLQTVIDTAVTITTNGRRIRVVGLEVLIVAKYRAARTQDGEDLHIIAQRRFAEINWTLIEQLTSDVEFQDLRNTLTAYRDIPLG